MKIFTWNYRAIITEDNGILFMRLISFSNKKTGKKELSYLVIFS